MECSRWGHGLSLLQVTCWMAEFQLDIKEIDSQDAAINIAELLLDSAIDEKGLRKEFVHNFLNGVLHNLENPSISPKTKFYSLFMLKEISTKDKSLKVFSTFGTHPIYAFLQELALTVDPMKAVSEKGKALLPGDKQMGNNFMRLLLQSLVTWGTRFPTNSKKEPTKFRKTLTRLEQEKVVLPTDITYYSPNWRRTERPDTQQSQPDGKTEAKSPLPEKKSSVPEAKPVTPQGPAESKVPKGANNDNTSAGNAKANGKQKQVAEIKFMYNKIETLLGILQESQSMQEVQREIQSYHIKFEKDIQKLLELQGHILQSGDEQLIQLYFKLVQFFNEEALLYRQHYTRNQFPLYAQGYGLTYQRIFEEKKQSKPNSKLQPSIDKKLSEAKNESKPKPGLPPPSKPAEKIDSKKAEANQESKVQKENLKRKPSGEIKEREGRLKDTKNVIDSYFSKLEAASKSPHQGFSSIAKSLEKEKRVGASRLKTSQIANQLNKSKFTGGSTFSKSAVRIKGIFAAPPNPHVRDKSYEGELIEEDILLQRQLEGIRKEQGIRRLKASLFKSKYILYEDDCLQVGFKSVAVYEKVDRFTAMLDFQLFFGNKTGRTIDNFQVSFKGDKQSLVYTSPQVVDSTIFPESQVRLELLNIPKVYPFGLLTIIASYEFLEETRSVTALMPNSVLQQASYFAVKEEDLGAIWGQSPKKLRTDQFKLSHHFPPDQLTHFLPLLKERTPYSRFAEAGSTTDYELFCEVVVRESAQALLKVVIRPDLSVVLQAGVFQGDEESVSVVRGYLQALRGALKEVES